MDTHEYFGLCASHDWYYNYSDDPSVYRRGSNQSQELMRYLKSYEKYKEIYSAWRGYIYMDAPKPDFKDFK